jgi:hypothetical protein
MSSQTAASVISTSRSYVDASCGTVAAMALLSQMFRHVAITGRTDDLNAWFATRQGGRWAEQKVRAAFPQAQRTPPVAATQPPADPAERLRQLKELHRRGVVTDAEFESLAAGLRG